MNKVVSFIKENAKMIGAIGIISMVSVGMYALLKVNSPEPEFNDDELVDLQFKEKDEITEEIVSED